MDSACTVDLLDRGPTPQVPASGFWREAHPPKIFSLFRVAKVAGLALSFAVSPLTTMPDPWLLERKRRDAAITVSVYQEAIGRLISRSEAMRIAREILDQAERERLMIAEVEAARGIHWEDEG
jgi:hypothetical protein